MEAHLIGPAGGLHMVQEVRVDNNSGLNNYLERILCTDVWNAHRGMKLRFLPQAR